MTILKKNPKRVLYFIKGPVPTKEQIARAEKRPEFVSFRNANLVGPDVRCEPCDGVMGFIPKQYQDKDHIKVISVKEDENDGDTGTKAPEPKAASGTKAQGAAQGTPKPPETGKQQETKE